jgi:molybdopterin-guanine dinucleotide biosynthesis protein
MAVVVVGGHSRNVGKTSVVAGIIAAIPERQWTAMKITQYGHGVCSKNGKLCHCATADHSWAISEEKDTDGKSDTSRLLAAGAKHVYWVRTQQGQLEQAMPAIQRRLEEVGNAILESNSVMKFIQPDVYLTVLDPSTADFKASAQRYLDRADAVILHNSSGDIAWQEVSRQAIANKPIFAIQPPAYLNPEIIDFLRKKLGTRN